MTRLTLLVLLACEREDKDITEVEPAETGETGSEEASPPILADYASEPRETAVREDGYQHVDSPLLVDQLLALNVNTYAFLIWHSPSDLDDLSEYLALAEPAGIDTWAYLVPPSEITTSYPPFELDYVAWADAIGQVAAAYPSVQAIAMDDFFSDTDLFTGPYICEMMAAAQAYAPHLKFYAVTYYPWVMNNMASADDRTCIDGLIFPYMDLDSNAELRAQIDAIAGLRDGREDVMQITYPWNFPSVAGDYGRFTATCEPGELSVEVQDDYSGETAGYHIVRVREDGEALYEEDVAGEEAPGAITLTLSGGQVSLGLEDDVAVYNFGVQIEFSGLSAPTCGAWTWETSSEDFNHALGEVEGWSDMELIPMIYAAPTSWHPTAPTTETIAEGVEISLQAWEEGVTQGVITYCLDKSEGSEDALAISEIYAEAGASAAAGR